MRIVIQRLSLIGFLLASALSRAAESQPRPQTDTGSDHRYAFVAAGAFGLTGALFGFIARGQQDRSQSLSSAAESARAHNDARQAANTANLFYALAGASLLYAVVLEVLPPSAAEKATLRFRF